jgi:hypothetical protein
VKVAVLGCGPAGLLAAHAATLCGHSVNIYSKRMKSPMEGAQYLHMDIPGLRLPPPKTIQYSLIGDVDTYRQKVYGAGDPDIVVSPQQYQGSHKCWDLRFTYSRMWNRWAPKVHDVMITHQIMEHLVQMNDVIISSIPATTLCHNEDEHTFAYQPVSIDNLWSGPLPAEAPRLWDGHENMVICNGLPVDDHVAETGWYRTSHIYGHMNTEWSSPDLVPKGRVASRVWRVRKPLSTDCTCWSNIMRVGRYGLWQKGVLSHHAYEQVMARLS